MCLQPHTGKGERKRMERWGEGGEGRGEPQPPMFVACTHTQGTGERKKSRGGYCACANCYPRQVGAKWRQKLNSIPCHHKRIAIPGKTFDFHPRPPFSSAKRCQELNPSSLGLPPPPPRPERGSTLRRPTGLPPTPAASDHLQISNSTNSSLLRSPSASST